MMKQRIRDRYCGTPLLLVLVCWCSLAVGGILRVLSLAACLLCYICSRLKRRGTPRSRLLPRRRRKLEQYQHKL